MVAVTQFTAPIQLQTADVRRFERTRLFTKNGLVMAGRGRSRRDKFSDTRVIVSGCGKIPTFDGAVEILTCEQAPSFPDSSKLRIT